MRRAGRVTARRSRSRGGPGSTAALEIDYFPSIGIAPVRYQIEHKPNPDGHRRFTVTAVRSGSNAISELAIDDGGVARRTAGSEVTTRMPRARQ